MVKSISYERARRLRLAEGKKLIKEKIKLEKSKLKRIKIEEKEKERKRKKWKDLKKELSKKVVSKKILKKGKSELKIGDYEPAQYVSRYFKDEIEEAKKSMFLK